MSAHHSKIVSRLPLRLILSLVLLIASCQRTPSVHPSPIPNETSSVILGQPTKVVLLITPPPSGTADEKQFGAATQTNDAPSLPDIAMANGISISLEQVEETDDGYILKGKISKVHSLWLTVLLGEGTQLLDAQGGVIPTKYYSDGKGGTTQDAFEDWGLQTIGKDYPGPWKLTIPSLIVELSHKVSFTVDLGFAPQIGQSFDVNLPVDFAGYPFFVQKVEFFLSEKNRPCLNFLFTSGPEIFRISGVTDAGNRSRHTDMQVSDANNGSSFNSLCYDQMPAGIHSFDIYLIDVIQQGPWTLHWQPPEE